MSKSKSKTFPKATNYREIDNWLADEIFVNLTGPQRLEVKYLITITKYEEKEFSEKGREKE